MNFILKNWVKYYTKESLKTLKVALVGSGIILTVVGIKYRPAYQVTLSGENLGYVESKEFLENKIDRYMNDTTGNIAFREIAIMPEYELKLIDREKQTEESEVMLAVANKTVISSGVPYYKYYAILENG